MLLANAVLKALVLVLDIGLLRTVFPTKGGLLNPKYYMKARVGRGFLITEYMDVHLVQ